MIKPCKNYDSNHPCYVKGTPSYTCKGCLNADPYDDPVGEGVEVNCKNFEPIKDRLRTLKIKPA